MNLQLQSDAGEVDALALVGFESQDSAALPVPALAEQNGWLNELRSSGEFSGKLYETVTLHRPQGTKTKRLVLIGGGKKDSFSQVEWRRVAAVLVRSLKAKGVKTIALSLEGTSAGPEDVTAIAEGAVTGAWEPDKYKTDPNKTEKQISTFVIVTGNASGFAAALERGKVIGEAQNFTRDLINEPGNKLTPAALADHAKQM